MVNQKDQYVNIMVLDLVPHVLWDVVLYFAI